jgi:hypothetical protein
VVRQIWYTKVNGKNVKVIPDNIYSLLTPRALAYWISGDGSFEKSGSVTILCTDSFTAGEVDLLRTILLNKFHIDSTLFPPILETTESYTEILYAYLTVSCC